MKRPEPSFSVKVDRRNPGQFFACCGLLELAHRLWPGAEGWFDHRSGEFHFRIIQAKPAAGLQTLLSEVWECSLRNAMRGEEEAEVRALKRRKRELKRGDGSLSDGDAARLKELEARLRVAPIELGRPFSLRLDWWLDETNNAGVKTWAGQQNVLDVAKAMHEALKQATMEAPDLMGYGCRAEKEPFYFDARRAGDALDIGFSPDVQDFAVVTYPAVELFCLVGLQRCRPRPTSSRGVYDYWVWDFPLSVSVANAVACGALRAYAAEGFRFRLQGRDRQNRYKAFQFAMELGVNNER